MTDLLPTRFEAVALLLLIHVSVRKLKQGNLWHSEKMPIDRQPSKPGSDNSHDD